LYGKQRRKRWKFEHFNSFFFGYSLKMNVYVCIVGMRGDEMRMSEVEWDEMKMSGVEDEELLKGVMRMSCWDEGDVMMNWGIGEIRVNQLGHTLEHRCPV